MKLLDIFRLSLSNLFGNKMRSMLTVLGVSVGIGAIVFLVGLGFGLQELTITKIKQSAALTSIDVTVNKSSALKINDKTIEDIKKIDNVSSVESNISMPGKINYNITNIDSIIAGTTKEYLDLSGTKIVYGNLFENTLADDPAPIVVSTMALDLLDQKDHKSMIGKEISATIYIAGEDATSQATEETIKFKIIGISQEDSPVGYIPLDEMKALKINNYTTLKVKADSLQSVNPVKEKITALGYNCTSITDIIDQANQVFKFIQIALAAMGIIALVVSSIGMFNTMTVALLERTRNIGIMKSIGATSGIVKGLFVIESGLIGLGGGAFGVLFGLLASVFVNLSLNKLATSAGGEEVNVFLFPTWFLISVVAFSFFVGFLTGLYPARRAAKLNPLDALRYE